MKYWILTMLFFCHLLSYSQSIDNTLWRVQPQNGAYTDMHFINDTLYGYVTAQVFESIAVYVENGNQLSITDLSDDKCSTTEIGNYSFAFSDTLNFEIINDACQFRENIMVNSDWLREYFVATNELNQKPDFKIFPNPTSDYIQLEVSNELGKGILSIYNSLGERILSVTLVSGIMTIPLIDLLPGIYYAVVKNEVIKLLILRSN